VDRAIEVAATLELRGHSLDRPVRPRKPRTATSPALIFSTVLIAAVGTAGLLLGAGGFETYPLVEVGTGGATLALCAVLPLLAWLPFAPTVIGRRPAPIPEPGDARA
jgi:hypothetical protein